MADDVDEVADAQDAADFDVDEEESGDSEAKAAGERRGWRRGRPGQAHSRDVDVIQQWGLFEPPAARTSASGTRGGRQSTAYHSRSYTGSAYTQQQQSSGMRRGGAAGQRTSPPPPATSRRNAAGSHSYNLRECATKYEGSVCAIAECRRCHAAACAQVRRRCCELARAKAAAAYVSDL